MKETPFGVRIKSNVSLIDEDTGLLEIPLGKPVTLTCVANPDIPTDSIYYVLWYQESKIVSYDERLARHDGRVAIEQDIDKHEWRLTIKKTSEEDLGIWKCVMETGYVHGKESSIAVVNLTAEGNKNIFLWCR